MLYSNPNHPYASYFLSLWSPKTWVPSAHPQVSRWFKIIDGLDSLSLSTTRVNTTRIQWNSNVWLAPVEIDWDAKLLTLVHHRFPDHRDFPESYGNNKLIIFICRFRLVKTDRKEIQISLKSLINQYFVFKCWRSRRFRRLPTIAGGSSKMHCLSSR